MNMMQRKFRLLVFFCGLCALCSCCCCCFCVCDA